MLYIMWYAFLGSIKHVRKTGSAGVENYNLKKATVRLLAVWSPSVPERGTSQCSGPLEQNEWIQTVRGEVREHEWDRGGIEIVGPFQSLQGFQYKFSWVCEKNRQKALESYNCLARARARFGRKLIDLLIRNRGQRKEPTNPIPSLLVNALPFPSNTLETGDDI